MINALQSELTINVVASIIVSVYSFVDVARREISPERLCEKINQSLLNRSLEECG